MNRMRERDNRERNRRPNNSQRRARMPRRYSNGAADNPFESYPSKNDTSFRKVLTVMTIVFFMAIAGVLLFANNQSFIDSKLGQNSFISKLFAKLSLGNNSKDKPEFNLHLDLNVKISYF